MRSFFLIASIVIFSINVDARLYDDDALHWTETEFIESDLTNYAFTFNSEAPVTPKIDYSTDVLITSTLQYLIDKIEESDKADDVQRYICDLYLIPLSHFILDSKFDSAFGEIFPLTHKKKRIRTKKEFFLFIENRLRAFQIKMRRIQESDVVDEIKEKLTPREVALFEDILAIEKNPIDALCKKLNPEHNLAPRASKSLAQKRLSSAALADYDSDSESMSDSDDDSFEDPDYKSPAALHRSLSSSTTTRITTTRIRSAPKKPVKRVKANKVKAPAPKRVVKKKVPKPPLPQVKSARQGGRQKWSKEALNDIKRRVNLGETNAEIAEDYKVTPTTIRKVIFNYKLKTPSRKSWKKNEIQKVHRLVKAGKSNEEIANEINAKSDVQVTANSITRLIERNGLNKQQPKLKTITVSFSEEEINQVREYCKKGKSVPQILRLLNRRRAKKISAYSLRKMMSENNLGKRKITWSEEEITLTLDRSHNGYTNEEIANFLTKPHRLRTPKAVEALILRESKKN